MYTTKLNSLTEKHTITYKDINIITLQNNKMTEATQTTNETLVKLCKDGFNNSVNVMVDDIMKEYMERLKTGTQQFRYLKYWHEQKEVFMAPVYTPGDKMKENTNTILQSDNDVKKFEIAVLTKLVELYGVYIHSSEVKYMDNKTGWHHMKFDIVLALEPKKE